MSTFQSTTYNPSTAGTAAIPPAVQLSTNSSSTDPPVEYRFPAPGYDCYDIPTGKLVMTLTGVTDVITFPGYSVINTTPSGGVYSDVSGVTAGLINMARVSSNFRPIHDGSTINFGIIQTNDVGFGLRPTALAQSTVAYSIGQPNVTAVIPGVLATAKISGYMLGKEQLLRKQSDPVTPVGAWVSPLGPMLRSAPDEFICHSGNLTGTPQLVGGRLQADVVQPSVSFPAVGNNFLVNLITIKPTASFTPVRNTLGPIGGVCSGSLSYNFGLFLSSTGTTGLQASMNVIVSATVPTISSTGVNTTTTISIGTQSFTLYTVTNPSSTVFPFSGTVPFTIPACATAILVDFYGLHTGGGATFTTSNVVDGSFQFTMNSSRDVPRPTMLLTGIPSTTVLTITNSARQLSVTDQTVSTFFPMAGYIAGAVDTYEATASFIAEGAVYGLMGRYGDNGAHTYHRRGREGFPVDLFNPAIHHPAALLPPTEENRSGTFLGPLLPILGRIGATIIPQLIEAAPKLFSAAAPILRPIGRAAMSEGAQAVTKEAPGLARVVNEIMKLVKGLNLEDDRVNTALGSVATKHGLTRKQRKEVRKLLGERLAKTALGDEGDFVAVIAGTIPEGSGVAGCERIGNRLMLTVGNASYTVDMIMVLQDAELAPFVVYELEGACLVIRPHEALSMTMLSPAADGPPKRCRYPLRTFEVPVEYWARFQLPDAGHDPPLECVAIAPGWRDGTGATLFAVTASRAPPPVMYSCDPLDAGRMMQVRYYEVIPENGAQDACVRIDARLLDSMPSAELVTSFIAGITSLAFGFDGNHARPVHLTVSASHDRIAAPMQPQGGSLAAAAFVTMYDQMFAGQRRQLPLSLLRSTGMFTGFPFPTRQEVLPIEMEHKVALASGFRADPALVHMENFFDAYCLGMHGHSLFALPSNLVGFYQGNDLYRFPANTEHSAIDSTINPHLMIAMLSLCELKPGHDTAEHTARIGILPLLRDATDSTRTRDSEVPRIIGCLAREYSRREGLARAASSAASSDSWQLE